ncbi:MAG: CHAT domain-containing protein [Acidobacteriaceae bacterium]|nr:CHAT domain-containing protein [Acidobacteriaceae bacterium]MBV9295915.1 CHAT domain-containing protein [Acidobacteriaceae bacterium]MBV9765802.1 CHAT domain-containing protein [Acidobacteriaceae bacterium]
MDTNDNQQNVLFVVMHLDPKAPNPFKPEPGEIGHEEKHYLLVNVVDPKHRRTSAPVSVIELRKGKIDTYNGILSQFKCIMEQFHDDGGFIAEPASFDARNKRRLQYDISTIGRLIYDLFQPEAADDPQTLTAGLHDSGHHADPGQPVRDWLNRMLSHSQRPDEAVTIVTNDFSIPWFWLKCAQYGLSLCEVCSLGILQLQAKGRADEVHHGQSDKSKKYKALLIKGSSDLAFLEEELGNIQTALNAKRSPRTLDTEIARTNRDLELDDYNDEQLCNDFRIVHFSGHYTKDGLFIDDKRVRESKLRCVLQGSLLILDGCSSGRDLSAWTDVETLTSRLINDNGVLGCIVTAIPVKHDPLASKIFWQAFYLRLLSGDTIGNALVAARLQLREHFKSIEFENPMWECYQLIGNPVARLFDASAKANA